MGQRLRAGLPLRGSAVSAARNDRDYWPGTEAAQPTIASTPPVRDEQLRHALLTMIVYRYLSPLVFIPGDHGTVPPVLPRPVSPDRWTPGRDCPADDRHVIGVVQLPLSTRSRVAPEVAPAIGAVEHPGPGAACRRPAGRPAPRPIGIAPSRISAGTYLTFTTGPLRYGAQTARPPA